VTGRQHIFQGGKQWQTRTKKSEMNVTSQAARVVRNQVAASRVAANRAAAKKAVTAVARKVAALGGRVVGIVSPHDKEGETNVLAILVSDFGTN